MRLRWLCSLLMLFALLLSAVPAQAAVIPISPAQPPRILPNVPDYDKIRQLQTATSTIPASPISPDDTAMLVVLARSGQQAVAFMNIQDGSLKAVSLDVLDLTPYSNLAWKDANTLVYISLAIVKDSQVPVVVAIDKRDGSVKFTPADVPAEPISLSPDGRRILMALPSHSAGSSSTQAVSPNPFKSTFSEVIKRGFDDVSSDTPVSFLSKINWVERKRLNNFETGPDGLPYSTAESELAVYDLQTGQLKPLLTLAPRTGLFSLGWSQDGSRLALARQTLSLIGRTGNVLNDIANEDALGNLAPANNPFFQGSFVDTVDFSSGKVSEGFLSAASGNGDFFGNVSWSTDNSTLLTQMEVPSHLAGRANPIYVFPERSYLRFYSADGKLLNTLDKAEIDAPSVSAGEFISADEVLIQAANGTNIRLYYYNRTSGEFRQLPIADGVAGSIQPTHKSRQVVFNYSSFTQAPDMLRINWDGSALYRLTFYNQPLTDYGKVRADPVSYTLANGQVRSGYLLQKADAVFPPRNTRLIVWQEGGPTGPFLNQWATNVENPFNLLPNFGFAVLFVPLEGREGFGKAALNALADNRNFGQVDIDEMAEIVQQSIDRGWTVAGSVGITGCSYGGYFTSMSIVRHPTLYTAANTQCTLLDLFYEWQFGYTPYVSYLMGRSPISDPAEYTKDSPLYGASAIKAATLIFDGTQDFLPVQLSVNLHDQLQNNGLATNMLIFDREGHGLSIPHSQLVAAQSQVSWFQQFLPVPATPVPAVSGS